MNASGKSTRRALPAASAATSAIRPMVASRSKRTGSTWAQATVTGSRMNRIVAVSAPDAQHGAHSELGVVRHRAPEAVAARTDSDGELGASARLRQREAERVRAADPAQ